MGPENTTILKPMGISQYRLAKSIGVPLRRIGEIVAGKSSITVYAALRLARFFRTDAPELDGPPDSLRP